MTTYKILFNCFIGGCAIYFFILVAGMIKARSPRGLIIPYALMGISVVVSIVLDIVQAFFLSNAPEKYIRIIQKLDQSIVGYILGLATIIVICLPTKKKDKNPNQSTHSITASGGSE